MGKESKFKVGEEVYLHAENKGVIWVRTVIEDICTGTEATTEEGKTITGDFIGYRAKPYAGPKKSEVWLESAIHKIPPTNGKGLSEFMNDLKRPMVHGIDGVLYNERP